MSLPTIKRSNASSSDSPVKKVQLRQKPVVIPSLKAKVQEISKQHTNIKLIHSFLNNKSTVKLSPLKHDSARRIKTQIDSHNGHFLDPSKILLVSSSKWTIFDAFSEKYIRGFKNDERHQLNKFSKLLVFYCVYAISQKYVLDIAKFQCIVTLKAELKAGIKGLLNRDQLVSLQTLLYIMTFQQSYQSEYVIAVNMGAYLAKRHKNESFSVFDIHKKDQKTHLQTFSMFMNTTAKVIGLQQTKITSLMEEDRVLNVTCADDVARLSLQCVKIPMFNKIVSMKSYNVKAKCVNEDGQLESRQFVVENQFENTKYLPYKFICKNDSRNFALSSCSAIFEEGSLRIVIVMLNSHSNAERDKDIQKSIEWYLKKLKEGGS